LTTLSSLVAVVVDGIEAVVVEEVLSFLEL
jgi:hypothetical protein